MKVVLDTSVLIAAFYKPLSGPSFSSEVYDYIVENETPFVSPYILNEFKSKCVTKLRFTKKQTRIFQSLIKKKVRVASPRITHKKWPKGISLRDPKDRPILELSFFVNADLLLSWDKDLLALKQIGSLHILNPRQFWDSLAQC